MPHLDLERLAALDHDAPTAEELAHLSTCAACRREQEAFGQLADLVVMQSAPSAQPSAPPLTRWEDLSPVLRAEGLLAPPAAPAAGSHMAPRRPWWTRAAAAAALLVVGVALGRASVGGGSGLDAGAEDPSAMLASGVAEFGSVAEASAVLDRAQRDYERASFWLASHDTTVNAQSVYRARLAALEQMLTASREGLYSAPQDPVLNQYYLAAYTAREATLRQLGAALPVDRVMESF